MSTTANETRQFESLLEFLKQNRGFDFTGYKPTSLMRRVRKRMQMVGINDFTAYSDYLEVHPDEFGELFNTVLINVTGFLRDPEAWDALQKEVIAKLAEKPEDRPIRVWSAGCASGEETYTLVMVFAEVFGIERFKKQVKIYATDADLEALTQARQAAYSAKELEPLPQEWRERYFEASANGFVFRQDLRRCIIFGEHDLVRDAPISRLDLLVCRNTLIYFNSETQSRILARFHFALCDEGFLFLGKAEMLLTHSRLYSPLDMRSRIFRKIARIRLQDRLLLLAQTGEPDPGGLLGNQVQLREASFIAGPVAQLVLDRFGTVVLANDAARSMLNISHRDIGKPIQDLEISYRPVELRSRIDEAYEKHEIVIAPDIQHVVSGEVRYFDVQVTPILDNGNSEPIGASVTFVDVTLHHTLRQQLEKSSHELETAYEELQATNEELETTNEELQSTIEELETTNEELQSTNEELETMNEELQSTNEELETINEELRRRTHELHNANDFLETIMTSMRAAVAVVDSNLSVLLWNPQAEDMWGLRSAEVEGKSFVALDFGLAVDGIARNLAACMDGKNFAEAQVQAVNRRGRSFTCRVTCTRLQSRDESRAGLIIFMEEWNPA